ncbi:MAG: metal-dependent transcriptional regulator [Desulfurococcales archaeon]|nr:metal-dependent transcriptional regulator [Desulfurococcales archaeon]
MTSYSIPRETRRSRLTQRNIDYLRSVYKLGGKPGGCKVRISDLSKSLGVSASTVSIMVRRLEFKGLLDVEDNTGVCLTREGMKVLVEHLWKHGIIEVALLRAGVDEATAKEVADNMSTCMDSGTTEKLAKALGNPDRCPHGKRIPYPGEDLIGYDYCGL